MQASLGKILIFPCLFSIAMFARYSRSWSLNLAKPQHFYSFQVGTEAGRETTLHVVAAILHTLRDLRMLPVCSNVMIGEYPVWTRLVN